MRIFLLLILILLPTLLPAQGFNSRNGRNHPELKWQAAETEHFRIMYPARLSGIENRAAPIAEASYRALSKNLEVNFEDKIRIYLSDEDEISNGFAVPVGDGYTDIWVNTNEYADNFTGSEKWLRKVIAHELAHIFHFKAVKSNLGFFQFLFGNPLPGFWMEGLAQYQTEKWDSQRGDRWLRLAVFDDEMNYRENNSTVNARLRYAVGNSQLRYFAETYGDTSLARLLKYRDSFLGLKYHDFYSAFSKVTDKSYDSFYDEWRKHVNIYYNSLASGMNRTDSLASKKTPFPGHFLYDIKYSPHQKYYAVLSLTSLKRPVRRLYLCKNDSARSTEILAEGAISQGIDWSPDGSSLIYSRRTREKHGSLIYDLFLYDVDKRKERQLTHNRRAWYPAFSPNGTQIAYVVNEGVTSNIYLKDLQTRSEQKLTSYPEDTQLLHLAWNHPMNELVFHRFDAEGGRNLVVLDMETKQERVIDDSAIDNRMPVISPDGQSIAFTSLRDEVPNVFIYDLETGSSRRFTYQFAGAEAYDWLAPTPGSPEGRLVIKATEDKNREYLYLVNQSYSLGVNFVSTPTEYLSWKTHRPTNIIPYSIAPDSSLIQHRFGYKPLRNLTHLSSFAFPYYGGPDHYGIFGISGWIEPLGKHAIVAGGNISFKDFETDSYGLISYINNLWYPTLALSVYKIPGSGQFYGSDFLIEELTGGEIKASWPVDWFDVPYHNDRFSVRLRHVLVRPLETINFPGSDLVPSAEKARQTDLQLSWTTKKQKPYYNSLLHPIDGYGVRLVLTGSEKILGSETSFLIPDFSAYKILPGLGLQRFYLYGRFQAQFGRPLPQDFIGFSRYSNIDWPFQAGNFSIPFSKAERVRGYKSFASGKQVAFGSVEYRIPFLPSLQTSILGGFLRLGQTSLAVFSDAGIVWDVQFSTGDNIERRLGVGVELKNKVGLGPLNFVHSLGLAQPYDELFSEGDYDLYYQIKASVPF